MVKIEEQRKIANLIASHPALSPPTLEKYLDLVEEILRYSKWDFFLMHSPGELEINVKLEIGHYLRISNGTSFIRSGSVKIISNKGNYHIKELKVEVINNAESSIFGY